MQPESIDSLEDIRDAIANIITFVDGFDFARFERELVVQHATLWNLAMIGEAVNRLRRNDLPTAERISEFRRIISARNQITHGYDEVNLETTWRIVQEKLPILRREVEALLAE